jgi:hypothetical protein
MRDDVKGHTETHMLYTVVEYPGMEPMMFYFADHHKRAVNKLFELRGDDEHKCKKAKDVH